MTTDVLERNEAGRGSVKPANSLNLHGTLLVHVCTEGAPDALALAVKLAERSGAAVLGVAAEAFEPAWFGGMDYTPGSLLQAWEDALRERVAATRERFERETAPIAPRAHWCGEQAFPCEALTRHAAGADWVVVVRSPKAKGNNVVARPAELAMRTGLPVLVAPDDAAPLEARRIVVGWRDAREARRAIADAMPLLTAADEVFVLAIGQDATAEEDQASLDEVRRRLAQRGCKVVAERRPLQSSGVGAMLIQAAGERQADLIVVGGYAHSRLQEWVLGGVTRELCTDAPVYVLFSH